MTRKLADDFAYPPRVMRADRAAAYLSMGRSTFLKLVDAGAVPPGIRVQGMVLWDRLDLDAAVEDWKHADDGSENSWERIQREEEAGRNTIRAILEKKQDQDFR